jgi:hypothetical protein
MPVNALLTMEFDLIGLDFIQPKISSMRLRFLWLIA